MITRGRRGIGAAAINNPTLDSTTVGNYFQPGSFVCTWMPSWMLSDEQNAVCQLGSAAAPTPPPAPTASQVSATQQAVNACDPGDDACVEAATDSLIQQQITSALQQTQSNANAAVEATNVSSTPLNQLANSGLPGTNAPICGDGSTQWITGIDNCTLMEIGGVVVAVLLLIGFARGSGRSR